jgi:membrane fusion protein (multidrug efflux system)
MVTLQSLDPIFVDFYLPQQSLDQIKVGQTVRAAIDAFPGKDFQGRITAINSKVDSDSRNVQIRATLQNPDRLLIPGMYAAVTVDAGAPERRLTLPQTAIAYSSYGDSVFIVDDKGKDADGRPTLIARQVFVTTGATRGDQVAVTKGVDEGQTVVVAGQIKLRNGVPVKINNGVLPKDNPHPAPVDQ